MRPTDLANTRGTTTAQGGWPQSVATPPLWRKTPPPPMRLPSACCFVPVIAPHACCKTWERNACLKRSNHSGRLHSHRRLGQLQLLVAIILRSAIVPDHILRGFLRDARLIGRRAIQPGAGAIVEHEA